MDLCRFIRNQYSVLITEEKSWFPKFTKNINEKIFMLEFLTMHCDNIEQCSDNIIRDFDNNNTRQELLKLENSLYKQVCLLGRMKFNDRYNNCDINRFVNELYTKVPEYVRKADFLKNHIKH